MPRIADCGWLITIGVRQQAAADAVVGDRERAASYVGGSSVVFAGGGDEPVQGGGYAEEVA